jgi:hypothetical protein
MVASSRVVDNSMKPPSSKNSHRESVASSRSKKVRRVKKSNPDPVATSSVQVD